MKYSKIKVKSLLVLIKSAQRAPLMTRKNDSSEITIISLLWFRGIQITILQNLQLVRRPTFFNIRWPTIVFDPETWLPYFSFSINDLRLMIFLIKPDRRSERHKTQPQTHQLSSPVKCHNFRWISDKYTIIRCQKLTNPHYCNYNRCHTTSINASVGDAFFEIHIRWTIIEQIRPWVAHVKHSQEN